MYRGDLYTDVYRTVSDTFVLGDVTEYMSLALLKTRKSMFDTIKILEKLFVVMLLCIVCVKYIGQ